MVASFDKRHTSAARKAFSLRRLGERSGRVEAYVYD
jgi:hypothetical protein